MAGRPYLAAPAATLEILKKYDLHTQKKFGQNFLIDAHVPEKITEAAQVEASDCIIEIGPGIGTLTQFLAQKAGKVLAVEIDARLIPVLEETLADFPNTEILQADILEVDLHRLIEEEAEGRRVKIVANLPYYITTPILMTMLEAKLPAESYTVMVQKEVADRMQAGPGSKEYGALSLAVQYYTEPKIVMQVSPSCFLPQPKVGSTVIRLVSRNFLQEPDGRTRTPGKDYLERNLSFAASASDVCPQKAGVRGSPVLGEAMPSLASAANPEQAGASRRCGCTSPADEEEKNLFRIIRAAFGQRRKTLYNALRNSPDLSCSGEEIREAIEACGFRPDIRGEALSLEEFMNLTRALK